MEKNKIFRTLNGLKNLIGNTPLLEIHFKFQGIMGRVFCKAENLNMTGSIKDRMALFILNKAYQKEIIRPGDIIAEATSGNTGISFSAIGRALGHRVSIFMPDWMSSERINLLKSFGADIHLVSKSEGGFLGSIEQAENFVKQTNGFLPRQFSNNDNTEAHQHTTGPEIWWQMRFHSLVPDAFVAGVGTGGTIMGVGKFLHAKNPAIHLHPLEPANSPTLSTGYKTGKHRIQGISDEFIPPIVNLSELQRVISVDDGDAIVMAQKLAAQLGLGLGISSGANFIGALKKWLELGKQANVVTVFPDDNKKYLSTDLMKSEPIKNDFISTDVELLGFNSFKRVCYTCCDPLECSKHHQNNTDMDEAPLPFCPRRKTK
jgi:cysteine synthase A